MHILALLPYSVQGKYGEVIIVNKKHPLSASYAPGEDPTAQAAFWQLLAAMQAVGLDNQRPIQWFLEAMKLRPIFTIAMLLEMARPDYGALFCKARL